MSDLISRSALKEEIESLRVMVTGLRSGKGVLAEYAKHYKESVLKLIDEAQTVEAKPIVHCKDCEHWGAWEFAGATDKVKVCGRAKYMVGENGFCCYADMRGGKNEMR